MTGPSDDLEQRFRASLPDRGDGDCPSPDELWAGAAGELPFERVQALVDHGACCARCAEAWRILAEVRRAAAAPAPEAAAGARPLLRQRTAPPRRARGRAIVPLALSALAAVGVWVALRPPPVRPPPVERGNGSAGAAMRAESPGVQPAGNAVLRWS